MMRTVLVGNGVLAAEIATWLATRGELAALVLHQPDGQRATSHLPSELGVPAWTWPVDVDEVKDLEPDCLLSVLFRHRLGDAWLALPSWRAINLHPGLLPFNAGANPNVWPLVDGSPAGTTIHVMTPVIDGGEIISQRAVSTDPSDTAYTLYEKLMVASRELFIDTWPDIEAIEPYPQSGPGSRHRVVDLATLDPTEAELAIVDRLRARTFPPYGAEFDRDGQRWRVQVSISPITD